MAWWAVDAAPAVAAENERPVHAAAAATKPQAFTAYRGSGFAAGSMWASAPAAPAAVAGAAPALAPTTLAGSRASVTAVYGARGGGGGGGSGPAAAAPAGSGAAPATSLDERPSGRAPKGRAPKGGALTAPAAVAALEERVAPAFVPKEATVLAATAAATLLPTDRRAARRVGGAKKGAPRGARGAHSGAGGGSGDDESPTAERTVTLFAGLDGAALAAARKKKLPLVKARIVQRMVHAAATAAAAAAAATAAAATAPTTTAPTSTAPTSTAPTTTAPTTTAPAATDGDAFAPELDVATTQRSMASMLRRVSVGMGALVGGRASLLAPFGGEGRRSTILGRPSVSAPLASSVVVGVAPPLRPSSASGGGSFVTTTRPSYKSMPAMRVPIAVLEEAASDDDTDDVDSSVVASAAAPPAAALPSAAPPAAALTSLAAAPPCAHSGWATATALVMEYLTPAELLHVAPRVATTWRRAAATAYSWRVAGDMTARAAAPPPPPAGARRGKGVAPAAPRTAASRAWEPFLAAFPWGAFLADGAYKAVYKVWSAAARRLEAVSIMDVAALAAGGNLPLIQTEIQAGCLVSELVRARVAPNFVETYQVFLHAYAPDVHFPGVWGSREVPAPRGTSCPYTALSAAATRPPLPLPPPPRGAAAAGGEYQYIRMELCSGGDVEGFLRREEAGVAAAETAAALDDASLVAGVAALSLHGGAPVATARDAADAATARALLFQMLFALYAGRERLAMRHYDIKLLNFLLALPADVAAGAGAGTGADTRSVVLTYAMGDATFAVSLPAHGSSGSGGGGGVAKLADFGTADVRPATLGGPLKAYHFTTLENAPPEFLLDGDGVVQAYATDTWALGLCAVHLLTGAAPYEEVMAAVTCPPPLARALAATWRRAPAFSVLRCLLDCADGGDAVDDASTESLLATTLYRFCVLALDVHTPGAAAADLSGGVVAPAPLRTWLAGVLGLSGAAPPLAAPPARRRGAAAAATTATTAAMPHLSAADAAAVRAAFAAHAAEYNLWRGTAPLMRRARRRLHQWPGADAALRGMLAFTPAARWTAKRLLLSPAFDALRVAATPPVAMPGAITIASTAYAAATADALPDV